MRERWRRYWFGPGGRVALGVLRIGAAISVLWTLARLGDGYLRDPAHAPHDLYRAVGINRLYGVEPPPALLQALWYVAWGSTLVMLVGWRARVATAISFASALALASYETSFGATWSHDNNAPFLVHAALLGARVGDAISVDAWRARRRGALASSAHAYRWSVLLAQFAIGVMMASAAIHKLASGKFSLAWALSDNLRNQILVRFDFRGLPREPIGDWLLDDPVRWKTAALLNLAAQLAPIAAMFLVRRPVLRALCGLVFVTEVVGLALVMGFWNFHWLPLAVVFVDWDRLVARGAPAEAASPSVGRAPRVFVALFVALDLVIAFWRWPKLDQRANLYPFSSFPMFASIRAVPPYDEHRLYELFGARLEVIAESPLRDDQRGWVHHRMMRSTLHRARSGDAVRAALADFQSRLAAAHPDLRVTTLRVWLVATQAPPYPEPARLERVDVAVIGELDRDGTFRSLLGQGGAETARHAGYRLGVLEGRTFVVAPPARSGE